jgi:hypothetical protein
MTTFTVLIRCEITDLAALRLEALRLANDAGISEKEFTFYENQGNREEFYLGWLFDHGSPFEAGVQIEQTDVVADRDGEA